MKTNRNKAPAFTHGLPSRGINTARVVHHRGKPQLPNKLDRLGVGRSLSDMFELILLTRRLRCLDFRLFYSTQREKVYLSWDFSADR